MKVFTGSIFTLIKHVLYSIAGAVFLFFILFYFLKNPLIVYGVPSLIGIYLIYSTLVSDNIKIIIKDEGFMEVYSGGKLKHSFCLANVEFESYIKTTVDSAGSDSDCRLTVIDKQSGNRETIDCSMLGPDKYCLLLEALGVGRSEEPVKVVTKVSVKK